MMMLGNLCKRICLAIVRTQCVRTRPAYQASPMCGHWVLSLDPVPALLFRALPRMWWEEPALLPVDLLWAPGKALLSLGVLTCPVVAGVTRVAMGSCQACGDALGTARSW